ncbi:MAG: hypothetical protein KA143_10230 [Saprospiraceae bacterium]|nr:hypothetical protein [Saprospiraceae bacterium]
MLKKIKNIFVVEDESAPKKAVESNETREPAGDAVTVSANNGPVDIPEVSAQNRFLSLLAQIIEKNNQPGFDYFEYRQSLINLAKLNMDEATKYKSAYAAAQAMGVTPVTLVNSAQGYLNLLNQESQKFATAEQNQRNKVIEERKNELSNLGSQIEKKKEMILQMQAEVEQMSKSLELKKNEAAGFAEKLNATKQEFEVAMKSIAGQIAEDIQKMNQYLK